IRVARQYLESLRAAGVDWLPVSTQSHSIPTATEEHAMPRSNSKPPAEQPVDPEAEVPTVRRVALGIEERRTELQVLAQQICSCTRCRELASTRTQTVFGVGQPGVELCFVGEAPGADEDKQGEPFVGAAGQLLNRIIAACGLKREEVYICNTIKCRPPGNRT